MSDPIPDDILYVAGGVVAEMFPDAQCVSVVLVEQYAKPIARAILAERLAQKERDAAIADHGVKWSPEPVSWVKRWIDESTSRIAAAIRNAP